MELVNGFVCNNCGDVELAKKGIDPLNPKKAIHGSEVFAKDDADGDRLRQARLGENEPLERGTLGTKLNMLA